MKFEIRRTDFIPLGLPDIHFVLTACALACLGFLLVASSSIEVASDRFGQPLSFAVKHAIFLLIASIAGMIDTVERTDIDHIDSVLSFPHDS